MKFLFFFMGIPLMIMSFFETVDVLPYVSQVELMVDGNKIELTDVQKENLEMQVSKLFENSRTMPAFGVTTEEMFKEDIKTGTFVTLKFDGLFEVNGLPFDELVFKIEKDYHAFNLVRGLNGVFEGRCIYIDLDERDMSEIANFVETLTSDVSKISDETEQVEKLNKETATTNQ